MIMFTNRCWLILDIATLKWVMREKPIFQDVVARSPLRLIQHFVLRMKSGIRTAPIFTSSLPLPTYLELYR